MNMLLKSWRESSSLSAEEAAKSVGVSLPTWSRWETGSRRIPAERVSEIERITGIPREELRPDIFGPAKAEHAA